MTVDVHVQQGCSQVHDEHKPVTSRQLSAGLLHRVRSYKFTDVTDVSQVLPVSIIRAHRPDNGGRKYLWNVGKLLPDYTAQQSRTQPSSYSPPWEPHFSPIIFNFSGNKNKVTIRRRCLLEKLTVTQPVKFPDFYGTGILITVFARTLTEIHSLLITVAHATRLAHLPSFDRRNIWERAQIFKTFVTQCVHPSITSSLSGSNVLLNNLFSNTVCVLPSGWKNKFFPHIN
jgi:hypothetical protein